MSRTFILAGKRREAEDWAWREDIRPENAVMFSVSEFDIDQKILGYRPATIHLVGTYHRSKYWPELMVRLQALGWKMIYGGD